MAGRLVAVLTSSRLAPPFGGMEYSVIQVGSIKELEDAVRKMIGSGWVPLGGMNVYASGDHGSPDYYQAMVRKLDDIAASNAQMTDLKTEINYLNDELTEWLEDH
jgi:hypothetical protein